MSLDIPSLNLHQTQLETTAMTLPNSIENLPQKRNK